jgi:putative transposase
VGLLSQENQRGPRAPLSDPASLALVDEAIARWYATPTAPTQKSVYVRYVQLCAEQGIEPVEQTTPRHGERPWAVAHLDHTQCDLACCVLDYGQTAGATLGNVSRRCLFTPAPRIMGAVYVTLDPPSYRSCLMAIRQCVKRFERLPQDLVVDGGKDFQSV